MKNILISLLLLFALTTVTQAQSPVLYYTFDLTNPLAPYVGSTNLSTSGAYRINSTGQVGKYIILNKLTSSTVTGQNVPITNQYTVEFIYYARDSFGYNRDQVMWSIGNNSFRFSYPNIKFSSVTGTTTVTTSFTPNGSGLNSWVNYQKGVHFIACTFNSSTGLQQVYVDGFPVFLATIATSASSSGGTLVLGSTTSYVKPEAGIDEVAVYSTVLSSGRIYSDYLDFVAGRHYQYNSVTPAPTPTLTGSYDSLQFAPGYIIGSGNGQTVTVPTYTQLSSFPYPRYADGSTIGKNFNWMALDYLGGRYQSGYTTRMAVDSSSLINIDLAKRFNYYLLLNTNTNSTNYSDTSSFEGRWVAVSNRNKQYKTSAIEFWQQIKPTQAGYSSTVPYIKSQTLPNNHYLRDASGNFLSSGGTIITSPKVYTPASLMDSIKLDASTLKYKLSLLKNVMTDTLNLVNDNGEVFTLLDTVTLRKDPATLTSMSNLSFGAARDWEGNRWNSMWSVVHDSLHSIDGLSSLPLTTYFISGPDGQGGRSFYAPTWTQYRNVNTDPTYNHCSTFPFYPRQQANWWTYAGAFYGLSPLIQSKNSEEAAGNKYFTPYLSAGYSTNNETNFTPGSWLGLMKVLNGLGMKSFYAGYFNEASSYNPPNPPPVNPASYIWQSVIPVYAQSSGSWLSMLDSLMVGDVPCSYVSSIGNGYTYWSGSPSNPVVVRRKSDQSLYGFFTSIQGISNYVNNVPALDTVKVTVDSKRFTLNTRVQGSQYLIDLSSTNVVCVQPDYWDQAVHPYWYGTDIHLPCELDSLYITARKDIKTYPLQLSSSSTINLLSFNTVVSFVDSGSYNLDTLRYNFNLNNGGTYYLYVKARSVNGTSAGFTASIGATSYTQSNVVDTNLLWYKYTVPSTRFSFSLSSGANTLKLLPTSYRTELDELWISTDSSLSLPFGIPSVANPCSTAYVPSITPSSPITLCTGASQVLTCTPSSSYNWSTGATTQSITVAASGSYVVTATNGNGCSGSSPATVVTVSNCSCSKTDTIWFSNIYTTSARVKWRAVNGASYYNVVITDVADSSGTQALFPSYATNVVVNKLRSKHTYKTVVQSVCQDMSVQSSKTFYFVTK